MKNTLIVIACFLLASCSEKKHQSETNSHQLQPKEVSLRPNETNIDSLSVSKWVSFKAKYTFTSYPVKIYKGRMYKPDFSTISFGNDRDFKKYFFESIEKEGVNFAGHYTIIHKFCGAMCEGMYIVDRKTGKISGYLPTNDEGKWGYKYLPTSRLLMANTELLNDSMTRYSDFWGIRPELYEWTGKSLKQLQ